MFAHAAGTRVGTLTDVLPVSRRGFLAAAGLAATGLASSCGRDPEPQINSVEWTDLRASVRGPLVRPGDQHYESLAGPRNLRYGATMPEAVAEVISAEDVAAAVRWARRTETPFAVRGGGNTYAGASSSQGLLISTRRLNTARINGTTLTVGGGTLNADLAAVLPQGGKGELLLPTGACRTLGVVGQTLGGGIGPHSPWAGLTADCLRTATVVTADGTVVTASAGENADLLWALRGGAGPNVGVVTEARYELVTVPASRATTARLTFSGRDAALAAAVAFQRVRERAGRIVSGDLHIERIPASVQAVLTAQVLAGEATARDVLAPLLRIPGVTADVVERAWWDAYAWHLKQPPPARAFWNRSLYVEKDLPEDALGDALDVVARFPASRVSDERNGSLHIAGWVGGAVSAVAPDATAYVHRRARALLETSSWWANPGRAQLPATPVPPDIADWHTELWEVLLPHGTGRSYQNYADPELQDWPGAYYGDNLTRLASVKSRWDPDEVFEFFQGVPLPR